MIIDVTDLLGKRKPRKEVHLVYEEKAFYEDGEKISFLKPIELNGEIMSIEDILILDGIISTELSIPCSRCLASFGQVINIPIHEKFSTHPENEDDEIIFIDGEKIEIADIVKNNIILSLPFKKLCNDDCKGLCQFCGNNLNISNCNCGKDTIDPRLDKLKDLFSTD